MPDEPADDMATLRQRYEADFGKKAFHGWKEDTLRAKIAEGPPPAPEPPPPPAPVSAPDSKRIMLMGRNVFLPINRLDPNWSTTSQTEKVQSVDENGKRTRVDVHPALADFLVGRNQAELLD